MSRQRSLLVLLAVMTLSLGAAPTAFAAPTTAQLIKLKEAEAALKKGSELFKAKKFKEAGEAVAQSQAMLAQLTAEDEKKQLARNIEQLSSKVDKARALLDLEGVAIPKAEDIKPAAGAAGGGISFVKQVAPILVGRCGGCHVRGMRGDFSMATFASLEKGPTAGIVIAPGNSDGSRLIEQVVDGIMPPNGKLSAEEIATLKSWVDQGAKFDGEDKMANLASLVTGAMPEAPAPLQATAATGKETVSFASDIAPVLAERCGSCHLGRQPAGRLSIANFTAFLRGGESGAPLTPNKADESLIIKKLRGTGSGARMPLNADPLSDETIAKFEKWISEGATFDGLEPAQPLAEVIAYVFALKATHEELMAKRAQLADTKWRLAIPDDQASKAETENFLIVGNFGAERLAEIGKVAESQAAALTKILKIPSGKPMFKGRMTIYAFRQRFDYSEFGKMVERRSPPQSWVGHWGYDVIDAYGAIHPSRNDEYSLDSLVAQQITSAYVASQGRVPRWFADGAGRAMAARLSPKDSRVQGWEELIPSAVASSGKPDSFLTGSLPPEEADVLSYSFVRFLMSDMSCFTAVLGQLREGVPFDQALGNVYRATPSQLTVAWVAKGVSSGKTGKRGRGAKPAVKSAAAK